MKFALLFLFLISFITHAQISWNPVADIGMNTDGSNHPRIVMDGNGNPLVVWGNSSLESVMFSRWTGTSFTAPVALNPAWLTVATATWMGPDIAAKGDTVYVVVRETPESTDTSTHMFLMSSFNGGASFNQPVRIDNIGDSLSRFPTLAIDDSGNPVVAFMEFNTAYLDSKWMITRSTDFGQTFLPTTKASGYSGANAEVCDCCPGALIISGDTTAMLYRDNLSNLREIWTGISTDNSLSFPSGFAIDNSNYTINYCPSSGPDGIIVGDTLYSVFMSAGGGSTRTYLSKSSLSSGALSANSQFAGNITGLTQQNYPRIASYGSASAIVWKQNLGSSIQLPILFTENITNGFPTIYDTVKLDNILNVDVALSGNQIFVVWQDNSSATVKYRYGAYGSGITSLTENNVEAIKVYPNPVNNTLWLTSTDEISQAKIELFSISGETLYSGFQTINANSFIDVSFLNCGIYILRLEHNGNVEIQKIEKK